MARKVLNELMTKIGTKGGMSLTSNFDVRFDFPRGEPPAVAKYYTGGDRDAIHFLCDEAQLPNVQSAVGNLTGRYLGEGQINYPHTRIFTDISLGFLLDADLTALKFFQTWYDYIFGEADIISSSGDFDTVRDQNPRPINRPNRLNYPDDYTANLRIIKTEPDQSSYNGRAPVTYILENAYPYAIDAVPLSYGASQIARVNVNFYYTRHTVSYGMTP